MRIATPTRVRFVAAAMIGLALLCVAINLTRQHGGVTPFGPELGPDYAAYYLAGQILNTEPTRLYDLPLQEGLYRQLMPAAPVNEISIYPGAPFLAVLYRPLALLPYAWSYVVWLTIGAGLAVAGFWLLWKTSPELSGGDWPTAMLATLSFMPFLLEGWIGGQTTPLVFFCVALAAFLQQRNHQVWAGVVLAVLTFKPTLPLLLFPMLVVTRSVRVLLGLLLGGLGLTALSIGAVGWEGCRSYVRFLIHYAEMKRLTPESLTPWKYVDLRSALYPVFYHPSLWASALLLILVLGSGLLLVRSWWQTTDKRLAWATALAWTPVLSPHLAIYDASLVAPAVLLAAGSEKSPRFWSLVALVYLTAWFSQPIAALTGFQPLSLAIALLALELCLQQLPTPHGEERQTPAPD